MVVRRKKKAALVSRISVSLPENLLVALDDMVERRGFESRSQALGEMISAHVIEHAQKNDEDVMVGTITVFYDHATKGLQGRMAKLQYDHLDEVISSLHVHLMHDKTMEVILVQGPVKRVRQFFDAVVTLKGVITGKMELVGEIIPPLHPLPTRTEGAAIG